MEEGRPLSMSLATRNPFQHPMLNVLLSVSFFFDLLSNEISYSANLKLIATSGGMSFNQPRPLEVEEIKTLIQRWAYGAEVLHKAGADGMQLHGAHGYLLSQVSFGSPFDILTFRKLLFMILLSKYRLAFRNNIILRLYPPPLCNSSSQPEPTSVPMPTEETLKTVPESSLKFSTRSNPAYPRTSSSR